MKSKISEILFFGGLFLVGAAIIINVVIVIIYH